ncbi:DUF550 domain-containing protein [Escherichia coli]|nr:DUF550 domain-containing protein [Escherichia coli]ELK1181075.1 DUF550 domain-containing protein [Escherichia coli]ELR0853578.1 DUF550 domain-containing protein [Escherichia coli]
MITITKERLLTIKQWRETYGPGSNVVLPAEEAEELARIALASLEAKPIGAFHIAEQQVDGTSDYLKDGEWPIDNGIIEVYAAPPVPVVPEEKPMPNPLKMYAVDAVAAIAEVRGWNACRAAMLQGVEPASNHEELSEENGSSLQLRNLIRQRHAEWSDKTFGCVGPVGPLKHLSKEALEAAAEPDDLSEWADMQFLLWDAQRRAGISDAEITAAMEDKLKINMERQWPEPKDGEPRLHIKEPGNSPVIPDGWISCSDRMPEDTKMLLAFSQGKIVAAYWNWVINPIDYKKYRAFTYLSGYILDDVTHWMPLPEPPL